MNQQLRLHATDDMGFPICRCPACKEKSIVRNAQEVARMFNGIFKIGHDEQAEFADRNQDHTQDGGVGMQR